MRLTEANPLQRATTQEPSTSHLATIDAEPPPEPVQTQAQPTASSNSNSNNSSNSSRVKRSAASRHRRRNKVSEITEPMREQITRLHPHYGSREIGRRVGLSRKAVIGVLREMGLSTASEGAQPSKLEP